MERLLGLVHLLYSSLLISGLPDSLEGFIEFSYLFNILIILILFNGVITSYAKLEAYSDLYGKMSLSFHPELLFFHLNYYLVILIQLKIVIKAENT